MPVRHEAPSRSLPGDVGLPPKVQSVLEARLAQLSPPARELAGLAATIGREFSFKLLAQASGRDEETLVRELDELWQRRIVREHGADAYDFSHDKLREVAYGSMSAARRRLLHRQAAQALETLHAARPEDLVSGKIDWRGKIQHVNSGEARYFRDWPTMEAFVEELLHRIDPAGRHADEASQPDRTRRES